MIIDHDIMGKKKYSSLFWAYYFFCCCYYNSFRRKTIEGTLVPKLALDPFLTLSVRNGHKMKIPRVKSIVKTITNILLRISRTTIPNLKLFS